MTIKKQLFFPLLFALVMLLVAGCGSETGKKIGGNGQNCIDCHTNQEKLKADLAKDPLPKVEKSEETSGEG